MQGNGATRTGPTGLNPPACVDGVALTESSETATRQGIARCQRMRDGSQIRVVFGNREAQERCGPNRRKQWHSILHKRKRSLPNWRTWLPRHIRWSRRVCRSHRQPAHRAAQEGTKGGVYLKVAKEHPGPALSTAPTIECVKDTLTGPLLYAFSTEDPGAAGRLIKEFRQGNDKLKSPRSWRWRKAIRGRTLKCWPRCRPANRPSPCWSACSHSLPPCWSVLAEPGRKWRGHQPVRRKAKAA
jgi:hypothetical protein